LQHRRQPSDDRGIVNEDADTAHLQEHELVHALVDIAAVTGQLAARVRADAVLAQNREDEMRALYAFSRGLAVATDPAQIYSTIQEHLRAITGCRVFYFEPGATPLAPLDTDDHEQRKVEKLLGVVDAEVLDRRVEEERRCGNAADRDDEYGHHSEPDRGNQNRDQIGARDVVEVHELLHADKTQCHRRDERHGEEDWPSNACHRPKVLRVQVAMTPRGDAAHDGLSCAHESRRLQQDHDGFLAPEPSIGSRATATQVVQRLVVPVAWKDSPFFLF